MERVADEKEAAVCMAWLVDEHPEWIQQSAKYSGLTAAAYVAVVNAHLIDKGKSLCAKGRCAIISYERWANANRQKVVSIFPPTEHTVSLYLRDT